MKHDKIEYVEQERLIFGPVSLVNAGDGKAWALPGRATATTSEVAEMAKRNGWPDPRRVTVQVGRRVAA